MRHQRQRQNNISLKSFAHSSTPHTLVPVPVLLCILTERKWSVSIYLFPLVYRKSNFLFNLMFEKKNVPFISFGGFHSLCVCIKYSQDDFFFFLLRLTHFLNITATSPYLYCCLRYLLLFICRFLSKVNHTWIFVARSLNSYFVFFSTSTTHIGLRCLFSLSPHSHFVTLFSKKNHVSVASMNRSSIHRRARKKRFRELDVKWKLINLSSHLGLFEVTLLFT